MISLIDCNNFYASCQRVFEPNLDGKPIIVLSNNDGCIISRSAEAKAIPELRMAAPYFEVKEICNKNGVHIFSSNYTLYNSLSKRVMKILGSFAIRQEIYSIDESFLDLTGIPNLTEYSHTIRIRVKQWTGIPVSVGLGQTKVQAKFANYLAKKHKFLNNVCNLEELGEDRVNKAMQITNVSEVWGIGHRIGKKLQLMGINTVYDLKTTNANQIRNVFNINIERIVYELNGVKCIELEECLPTNKSIVSSRSFGKSVTSHDTLKAALMYHVEHACTKMRKQNLFAKEMVVFASTDRFKDNYLSEAAIVIFPSALDSFRIISTYIDTALKTIYKPGAEYKKCGIAVSNLITTKFEIKDLFDNTSIKHDQLLPILERIKAHFGKSAIKIAAANLSNDWHMQRKFTSNNFTTDLNELLVVV